MNKKKLILQLLIVIGVLQFFQIDKENPPVDQPKDFIRMTNPPIEVANILKTSCYDCHSHETKYPWYTNVSPMSWWIKHHINDGRKHLNFSTWTDYDAKKQDHKLDECIEEVEEGEMPLNSYLWVHSESKLTPAKKEALMAFFESKRTHISDK